MQAKTHVSLNDYLLYFLPITVSFLTYLIIFTPDKTLLIFWLSLTYLFYVYDQSYKSNKFHVFYSHLGHCSLEGNLQAPCLASPPGICLLSTFNNYIPPFLQTLHYDKIHLLCGKSRQVGKRHGFLLGNLNICPQFHQFELPCHTQAELSSIRSLKV